MRYLIQLCFMIIAGSTAVVHCLPANVKADNMWIADVEHGMSTFHNNPLEYQVYRNVMDFGCKGDGITDDTVCINTAISSGGRCGSDCGTSTLTPAIVYIPSGKYLVSSPIIMYYFTQLIGDARDPPTLISAPEFSGIAVLDSNPFYDGPWTWYTSQNNFFRQVRNFIIDMTQTPSSTATTGIHWRVAQATSLVNLKFVMSKEDDTQHQGIFMEEGSGGFMSDLSFEGGKLGAWLGNQQFLTRRLSFHQCKTAMVLGWNWEWTFKSLTIDDCSVGIDMSAATDPTQSKVSGAVGSLLLLDSTIKYTSYGIVINNNNVPTAADTSNTVLLDNLLINNVQSLVVDAQKNVLLDGGNRVISFWGRGSVYTDESGKPQYKQGDLSPPQKSASLLDGNGNFFEKSRPQYQDLTVDDFASVKAGGAKGDGVTDDSDAIQAVINQNVNAKVVYFPAGSYVLGKTVKVPSGTRLIGELWSVLMASGDAFQSESNPVPMIQVGDPGETGTVEITDLMFSTKGAQPGAVLVQWNLAGSASGDAGMWDCHFRIGGTTGSDLQLNKCPHGQDYTPDCVGAHTLLHLTATSSAYLENVWAWTADHDLDDGKDQQMITIYTGRGVLVESNPGPVWLYGIQSEHNVFYQYQISSASNAFLTMIQSETPYWQPAPAAPKPFTPNAAFNDPTYEHCDESDLHCSMAYALRAVKSSNVYVYGAGLYNFFFEYDTTCVDTDSCQSNIVSVDGNTGLYIYNLNTKDAVNMVVKDGTQQALAVEADNLNNFCRTLNAFLVEA